MNTIIRFILFVWVYLYKFQWFSIFKIVKDYADVNLTIVYHYCTEYGVVNNKCDLCWNQMKLVFTTYPNTKFVNRQIMLNKKCPVEKTWKIELLMICSPYLTILLHDLTVFYWDAAILFFFFTKILLLIQKKFLFHCG